MSITTEHSGYQIVYGEADNLWRCPQLGISAASLSRMRSEIDQIDGASRQLNIPAFLLDHSGFSITPVLVVRADRDGEHVWVINKVEDPRSERREKVSLQRLVEDTPENRRLLLDWRDASRAVYEEGQRVSQLRDSIPRMGRARVAPDDAAPSGGI
ncbi:hypothetical protein OSH08_00305 [Kaistia geumhonensis]|uniref:Uncharacterized protein n=1 Tax=Kaistia geumhonensis TaxID=410839 RepID=A0ABU0M8S9_9HYPH|nr:hypothetical protein [Kaistia geumhonensis]MCX5477423.1 hypothetical protein [Kaistia geumhonensis]MDQ0517370.1 hypothetical protein [Kaistia geumhonensis]